MKLLLDFRTRVIVIFVFRWPNLFVLSGSLSTPYIVTDVCFG